MLILLSVAAYTFSLNDVSVPNRFIPSTPARSSNVNANFDTLASRINQNNDTIEQKFIRFSDLESGDSILEKCRIDTARIDHIRSNPEADSMTITKADINGGTIDGTVIGANSAAAGTFTTVTASGVDINGGAIDGTVIGGSSAAAGTFTTVTASGVDINGGAIDGTVIGGSSAAAGTFTTVTVNGNGVWHSGNFNPDNYQPAITGTENKVLSIQAGGSGVKTGSIYDDGNVVSFENAFIGNSLSTGIRHYHDVFLYSNTNAIETGILKIVMPQGWSNTFQRITIKGYNYVSGQGAWECIVGGYNYAGGWINFSAEIRGPAPFSQVRLAHDGSKCVILLGTTGTDWRYAKVAISDMLVGSAIYNWETGWSASVVSDETGITNIVTPTTSYYGNRATIPKTALIGKSTAVGGYSLEVEGNQLVNGTIKADSINSTKGINCSTINTGFGNFEIGQNLRTTDNVFFNKTTADEMTVNDTIRIGEQVKLYDGWYLEGSYLCTLSGFTRTVTCTTYYVKCGKAVTLTFSPAADTSKNNYIHISTGLMPASIRPARALYWKLDGQSFGGLTATDPYFFYSHTPNNVFQITPFQSSDYKGITHSFSISYLTY